MNHPYWKNKEKDIPALLTKGESHGVCPKMFKEIINKCTYMEIGKREEFIYQGKPNNDIYILINGIACSTYCEGVKEITSQFFYPQRNIIMFNSSGSNSSLLTNEGFEGISKVSMLRLPKEVFEELIIQYPELNKHISDNYRWQQIENRIHSNSMQMHTPQAKIVCFYLRHPALYNNRLITAIIMANHLNVSNDAFCIHKKMVKERGYLN